MIDGTEAAAKSGKVWLSNEDYAAKLKAAKAAADAGVAKGASQADISKTLQSTHGLSPATAAKVLSAAKAVQGR